MLDPTSTETLIITRRSRIKISTNITKSTRTLLFLKCKGYSTLSFSLSGTYDSSLTLFSLSTLSLVYIVVYMCICIPVYKHRCELKILKLWNATLTIDCDILQ